MNNEYFYNDFAEKTTETLHQISAETQEKLENIETNNHNELLKLALELSIVANTNMIIANRILRYIEIQNDLKEK